MFLRQGGSINHYITRYSALAETPPPEPGQKSAYKEKNEEAINNDKLNRIKGEPHTLMRKKRKRRKRRKTKRE